jgi:hypothetical protein
VATPLTWHLEQRWEGREMMKADAPDLLAQDGSAAVIAHALVPDAAMALVLENLPAIALVDRPAADRAAHEMLSLVLGLTADALAPVFAA